MIHRITNSLPTLGNPGSFTLVSCNMRVVFPLDRNSCPCFSPCPLPWTSWQSLPRFTLSVHLTRSLPHHHGWQVHGSHGGGPVTSSTWTAGPLATVSCANCLKPLITCKIKYEHDTEYRHSNSH